MKVIELPKPNNTDAGVMVIGSMGIHIDDGVIKDGKVDVTAFQPLARLNMDYTRITNVFSMERPSTK